MMSAPFWHRLTPLRLIDPEHPERGWFLPEDEDEKEGDEDAQGRA